MWGNGRQSSAASNGSQLTVLSGDFRGEQRTPIDRFIREFRGERQRNEQRTVDDAKHWCRNAAWIFSLCVYVGVCVGGCAV
jgi:hypothetical protein